MSFEKIAKSDEEWQDLLSPEAYYVTREKGTEAAFSGDYHDLKESGIYSCVCCGCDLFGSNDKFDSGTGWPSFTKPLVKESLTHSEDASHGMKRIEVLCSRCDAHLGHVFDDGPEPTGKRYCINSIALDFKSGDES